jgi:hypothetical protein
MAQIVKALATGDPLKIEATVATDGEGDARDDPEG